MKNEIITKLNRGLKSAGFALKKHSPEILVVAGVAGTVLATVMACKATMKLPDILEEHKDTMDEVHKQVPEEEVKKATVSTYVRTGLRWQNCMLRLQPWEYCQLAVFWRPMIFSERET